MTRSYRNPHWEIFLGIQHEAQGRVGIAPATWVMDNELKNIPHVDCLSLEKLTRTEVRNACVDPRKNVLFGFVCAMSWGGQSRRNAQMAYLNPQLTNHLDQLRQGHLSRREAYMIFEGKGKILGLGPSYFTKLLYFFSNYPPKNEEPYIVDNMILDSMALLTGKSFNSFARRGSYQACCEEIDNIAKIIGVSGQEVEQRLFSGQGKPWRKYVNLNKSPNSSRRPYRNAMHTTYPHISLLDF